MKLMRTHYVLIHYCQAKNDVEDDIKNKIDKHNNNKLSK